MRDWTPLLKFVSGWTKETWTYAVLTPAGAGFIFWFCWALMDTSPMTGTPVTRNQSAGWWVMPLLMVGFWLLVWIPLGLTSVRDRKHRWLFTRTQVAQAKAADEAARRDRAERRIRAARIEMQNIKRESGDAGLIAYALGMPLEDVLKITERETPPS